MGKLCLIFILIGIMIPSAFAIINDSSLVFYVSFDNNVNDIKRGAVGTNVGAQIVTGKLGNGIYCDQDDADFITYPDSSWLDIGSQDFTICYWFKKASTIDTSGGVIGKGTTWNTAVDYSITMYHGGTSTDWDKMELTRGDGTADSFRSTSKASDTSKYHFICLRYDWISSGGSNATFYFNGTLINSDLTFRSGSNSTSNLSLCRNPSPDQLEGYVDEIGIWKKLLSGKEISQLYNNSYGCNPVTATCDSTIVTPSITLATDLKNNNKSTSNPFIFHFNGTVANTGYSNFNCTLKLNSTIQEVKKPSDIRQNQNFTINTTNWQRGYTYNVTCLNNNATGSFKRTNVYVDTVPPNLVISSTIINNSVYHDYDISTSETIFFRVNVTDAFLFAYNRSIINLNTGMKLNESNKQNINKTYYLDNYTLPINFGEDTRIKLSFYAYDSHTGEELKYKAVMEEGKIKYKDSYFYCEDFKKLDFIQLKDKVTFDIEFRSKKDNVCYFESSNLIRIYDSYPNHWVSFDQLIWFDDYHGFTERINDNKIKITYQDVYKIKSESLGDMNTASKVFYINITYTSVADMIMSMSEDVEDIKFSLENFIDYMEEEINMIGFVMLWLGLWALGYYALQTGNMMLGGTFIFMTVPIDIYFSYLFQEATKLGTGFIGIGFLVLCAWTFGIFVLIKRKTGG